MAEFLVRGSSEFVLVDDEDVEKISHYTWRTSCHRKGHTTVYVVTDVRTEEKTIKILLHRLILNAPAGVLVDHKNRNGLDNRKANLRLATNGQNVANRPGWVKSSSKFKGVYWDSSRLKWRASIEHNGKKYSIGRFSLEEDAAKAVDVKAVELFGEFAYLNFP